MKALMLATLLVSTLTLAAENLVSGWSPASNYVSFRIHCPEALTAGSKSRLIWVKCEARNEGTADIWLTNRARLFLTDSNGQVQSCLRRNVKQQDGREISYVRKLNAGETCSWWESGESKDVGRYGLQAVLDESGAETPKLQVSIAQFIEGEADYKLKLALEAAYETFPVAHPKEGEAQGTYHWMAFTNDPIVIDGELYYAFRFEATQAAGALKWSHIRAYEDSSRWAVAPGPGSAVGGFVTSNNRVNGSAGVPGLTRSGDAAIFETVSAGALKAGAGFMAWFRPLHGMPFGVMVSLNFTTNSSVDYRATPEAVEERRLGNLALGRTESVGGVEPVDWQAMALQTLASLNNRSASSTNRSGSRLAHPIPEDPARALQKDMDWMVATVLDGYAKSGHTDPKWDAPARAALTEYARVLARDRARKAGDTWRIAFSNNCAQALQAGCTDPLLKYYSTVHSYNFGGTDDYAAFLKNLTREVRLLQESSYHSLLKFKACRRAAVTYEFGLGVRPNMEYIKFKSPKPDDLAEMLYFRSQAIKNLCDALGDTTMPLPALNEACDNSRALLPVPKGVFAGEAIQMVSEQFPELQTRYATQLVPALLKSWPHASGTWLVLARMNIEAAWKARGTGYANTVTESGWKSFTENLGAAQKFIQQGWALNPDDPALPVAMISVELGIGEGRSQMELWFNRAMTADPGCVQACYDKLNYLLPQWHGSEEEMLKFGRQCVDSKTWTKNVPYVLCEAHVMIAGLRDESEREGYWKQPEVWKDIQRSLTRYQELNPEPGEMLYKYAALAYRCGQWGTVNQLLPQLPSKHPVDYQLFGGKEGFDKMVELARQHSR